MTTATVIAFPTHAQAGFGNAERATLARWQNHALGFDADIIDRDDGGRYLAISPPPARLGTPGERHRIDVCARSYLVEPQARLWILDDGSKADPVTFATLADALEPVRPTHPIDPA